LENQYLWIVGKILFSRVEEEEEEERKKERKKE